VVEFTTPAATDAVDGDVPTTCNPVSGSTFPLGTTTVTCTATDTAGNTASSTFPVTVMDTTAPVVAAHEDVSVTAAPGAPDAVVTYTAPDATDLVDGTVTVSCAPTSGSAFPVGTTTVVCTAVDRAGNTGSGSFSVTVNQGAPVENKADVKATITGPSTAVVGSRVTYTMTVTNNGPAAAKNLTSVLSTNGLTGITASPGGFTGSVKICGVTISGTAWTIPTLASGQSLTYTVTGTVSVRKGKYVTALGGSGSAINDPNVFNNIAAFSTRAS
jgi:hypothetical protein